MQLSKKKAFFSLFFSTFEVDKTEHFQKKNETLIADVVPILWKTFPKKIVR